MALCVDTREYVTAALLIASERPQIFCVYGYTVLQQFMAPHLRRLPTDLDIFVATRSLEDFRQTSDVLVQTLGGKDIYYTVTEHGQTVSHHFRCGPARFLDLTWESCEQRRAADASGDTQMMRIQQGEQRFQVATRSEKWFYQHIEGVLQKPPVGAHRFRWYKDMHNVHMLVASMVWLQQASWGCCRIHTMPWMSMNKYANMYGAAPLHDHEKHVRTWMQMFRWHFVCRCILLRAMAVNTVSSSSTSTHVSSSTQTSPRKMTHVSTQTQSIDENVTREALKMERARFEAADREAKRAMHQLRAKTDRIAVLELQVEKLQTQRQRWMTQFASLSAKVQILTKMIETVPITMDIAKILSDKAGKSNMEWGAAVADKASKETQAYYTRILLQMLSLFKDIIS